MIYASLCLALAFAILLAIDQVRISNLKKELQTKTKLLISTDLDHAEEIKKLNETVKSYEGGFSSMSSSIKPKIKRSPPRSPVRSEPDPMLSLYVATEFLDTSDSSTSRSSDTERSNSSLSDSDYSRSSSFSSGYSSSSSSSDSGSSSSDSSSSSSSSSSD